MGRGRGVAGVQELQELQNKIGIVLGGLILLRRGVCRGVRSQEFNP
jgi:hypothetical protein